MGELLKSDEEILDAAAVNAPYGNLILLGSEGTLTGWDTATGISTKLGKLTLPSFPPPIESVRPTPCYPTMRWRLHASPTGRFVAVALTAGTEGLVFDTVSQRVTLQLHAENYHAATVAFSACFITHQGRDVIVHRTAWNRLDASDAETGELLTAREPTAYKGDEPRPDHYLDYFHGELYPNPSCTSIVDDGWVWHPVSIPRSWSTHAWLTTNPWESEDGASARELILRDDWGTPMCWVDDDHLAIWGLGSWDEEECEEVNQSDGVRIMDTRTSDRNTDVLIPVPGPATKLFSDGRNLYVTTPSGTTGWDVTAAAQTSEFPDFIPTVHDRHRRELIVVSSSSIDSRSI